MNMLYEGLKQNSTIVLVPSSALDSMQLGGLAGITALAQNLKRNGKDATAAAVTNEPPGDPHALTPVTIVSMSPCRSTRRPSPPWR